jgi:glycerol-3-phosphate dehydrogenase
MDGLMISVLGVKLTSYRAASAEAVDLILRKLGLTRRFWTDKEPLPGARGFSSFPAFVESQREYLSKRYELEQTQSVYLTSLYGSRIGEICKLMDEDPSLARKICKRNPDILAEVVLAVKEEFTVSLSDFMMRRVPLAFSECRGNDCAMTVAELMGRLLGWNATRIETEVARYEESVRSQLNLRPRISTA